MNSTDELIMSLLNDTQTSTAPPALLNATIMNNMDWQYWFLIGVSTISLPLYIMIIITIFVRKPSVSTATAILSVRRLDDVFYNLIISQGFADLLAIVIFFLFNVLQSLPSMDPFFTANNSWAAPVSFNNVYFFVVLRSNGIMLFSLQRYLVFVKDLTSDKYKRSPFIIIFLIHWGPSFVIMLPVTTNFDKSFNKTNGAITIDPLQMGISSGIACATLILNTVVSAFCYVKVLNAIYRKSSKRLYVLIKFRKTREFRLSIQVFFQIVAMLNCLIYHAIQFYVVVTRPPLDYQHTLTHIRQYYPIITSELSFVNPWTFIFLNRRLRGEMCAMLGWKSTIINPVVNAQFMDRKSSILNNSGPRRASSIAHLSLANLPQHLR